MNIGFDASRANKVAKTGTEWYSYNLLLELAKIDHDNRYFLYTPDKLKGKLNDMPDNFYEKVLKWPPKYLWTMLRLSMEMLSHTPDTLFVPAHIIPLITPANTITTIMDVGFLRKPEVYSQKELKYHNFGLKRAIHKAKKILTISEFTKREMVELCGIDPDMIKVIYLGFDAGIFKPISDQTKINKFLEKYKIPTDCKYFFYIGRLEEKKNIAGLVKAFGKFIKENNDKNIKLVLAGSQGYNYEVIKKIIQEYNISSEIIETGWIEEDDLPYLYNGSIAFVFPSFYEGFGLPLLEAMSCGTPIIASDIASIPEVVQDSALLFNPNNSEEIKMAMQDILDSNEKRNELIEKGFKRVKYFSWKKCASETLSEIEKVSI